MNRYYYDLHLHSCLSPCGDADNTPNNLAGMGKLAGLQIMALTDHNTCRNCPAFFEAAARYGVIPVPGMELSTAEDIHMVCLFPALEAAMAFDVAVEARRVRIGNRPDIFGEQQIMDGEDRVIGEEPFLLSNATEIPLEESVRLAAQYGGIAYPAHVDRPSNSILAVLGTMPPEPRFSCVELHDGRREAELSDAVGGPAVRTVVGSDAHYLWDIRDRDRFLLLEVAPEDGDGVRQNLIAWLRGDV